MAAFNSLLARDGWRFALIVAVSAAALGVMNELPRAFGGEPRGIVAYDTPDAVAARYRESVWMPKSMPAGWDKRPLRIRVAVGDTDWLELLYGSGDRRLVVCQQLNGRAQAADPPGALLPLGDVLQLDRTTVGDRNARVRRLLLADGAIVHEVWWSERGKPVMVRLRGSLEELMRVARAAIGDAR